MLPLSDGLHPRRFPIVNVALIAANFAVWILYELPHLNSADLPRLLLPLHRRQRLPRARAVGDQLVHRDVHARELGATSSETCSSSPSSARTSRTRSGTCATSPSTSPAASSRR